MARFYGSMGSGLAPSGRTLTGGPGDGIRAHIRGWDLGLRVRGEAEGDADEFHAWVTRGSNGGGSSPTPLLAVVRTTEDAWGLDPQRGGWLGEAVNLLHRLTHPAADDQDLDDARAYLDALPTVGRRE